MSSVHWYDRKWDLNKPASAKLAEGRDAAIDTLKSSGMSEEDIRGISSRADAVKAAQSIRDTAAAQSASQTITLKADQPTLNALNTSSKVLDNTAKGLIESSHKIADNLPERTTARTSVHTDNIGPSGALKKPPSGGKVGFDQALNWGAVGPKGVSNQPFIRGSFPGGPLQGMGGNVPNMGTGPLSYTNTHQLTSAYNRRYGDLEQAAQAIPQSYKQGPRGRSIDRDEAAFYTDKIKSQQAVHRADSERRYQYLTGVSRSGGMVETFRPAEGPYSNIPRAISPRGSSANMDFISNYKPGQSQGNQPGQWAAFWREGEQAFKRAIKSGYSDVSGRITGGSVGDKPGLFGPGGFGGGFFGGGSGGGGWLGSQRPAGASGGALGDQGGRTGSTGGITMLPTSAQAPFSNTQQPVPSAPRHSQLQGRGSMMQNIGQQFRHAAIWQAYSPILGGISAGLAGAVGLFGMEEAKAAQYLAGVGYSRSMMDTAIARGRVATSTNLMTKPQDHLQAAYEISSGFETNRGNLPDTMALANKMAQYRIFSHENMGRGTQQAMRLAKQFSLHPTMRHMSDTERLETLAIGAGRTIETSLMKGQELTTAMGYAGPTLMRSGWSPGMILGGLSTTFDVGMPASTSGVGFRKYDTKWRAANVKMSLAEQWEAENPGKQFPWHRQRSPWQAEKGKSMLKVGGLPMYQAYRQEMRRNYAQWMSGDPNTVIPGLVEMSKQAQYWVGDRGIQLSRLGIDEQAWPIIQAIGTPGFGEEWMKRAKSIDDVKGNKRRSEEQARVANNPTTTPLAINRVIESGKSFTTSVGDRMGIPWAANHVANWFTGSAQYNEYLSLGRKGDIAGLMSLHKMNMETARYNPGQQKRLGEEYTNAVSRLFMKKEFPTKPNTTGDLIDRWWNPTVTDVNPEALEALKQDVGFDRVAVAAGQTFGMTPAATAELRLGKWRTSSLKSGDDHVAKANEVELKSLTKYNPGMNPARVFAAGALRNAPDRFNLLPKSSVFTGGTRPLTEPTKHEGMDYRAHYLLDKDGIPGRRRVEGPSTFESAGARKSMQEIIDARSNISMAGVEFPGMESDDIKATSLPATMQAIAKRHNLPFDSNYAAQQGPAYGGGAGGGGQVVNNITINLDGKKIAEHLNAKSDEAKTAATGGGQVK